jgi:hypothetical protein
MSFASVYSSTTQCLYAAHPTNKQAQYKLHFSLNSNRRCMHTHSNTVKMSTRYIAKLHNPDMSNAPTMATTASLL